MNCYKAAFPSTLSTFFLFETFFKCKFSKSVKSSVPLEKLITFHLAPAPLFVHVRWMMMHFNLEFILSNGCDDAVNKYLRLNYFASKNKPVFYAKQVKRCFSRCSLNYDDEKLKSCYSS